MTLSIRWWLSGENIEEAKIMGCYQKRQKWEE